MRPKRVDEKRPQISKVLWSLHWNLGSRSVALPESSSVLLRHLTVTGWPQWSGTSLSYRQTVKWFLSLSSWGKPTPYSLFPLLWPSRCQHLNRWKTKTASHRLKLEGALPASRKPQSSPALTSVQVCLLSSFSNCHWDSFPKISELGTIWIDWLIFWCYLSSLLSQTACVHKGESRWWVLRPLLAQSEPHFWTQMECITLHPG